MNFNVYIDDETASELNRVVEQSGESRNALIRQALRQWLSGRGAPQWPVELLSFEGIAEMPPFESARQHLSPPSNDPLA